ncbi:MAG: hypothetical protein V4679_15795 [Pseudomonadota bacterium]
MADKRSARKKMSNWRSVRMQPQHQLASTLQQRYSLRLHGFLIGGFTLLIMWCTSHVQMLLGMETLALRYLITLSVGYIGYLLVLRLWAARLVQREDDDSDSGAGDAVEAAGDVADMAIDAVSWRGGSGGGQGLPMPRSGGSVHTSGGSGDFGTGLSDAGSGLGDLASGAADAVSGADEGAVVVIPIVAIFLIGAAIVFGAGALAMLFFGWDVLLTVAVELAFSVVTARAAMGVEREGWLSAAVRLTWKPMLGAVVCAVALGAAIDHFLPHVNSLPEAVRAMQAGVKAR